MTKPNFNLGNSLIIFASLAMFISVMSLNAGYSNVQGFATAEDTNFSEYTQLHAEINKPVTWIKTDTQQTVETKPPEVVETDTSEVDGKMQKKITVSSDIHYENILTYASVPELLPEQVKLYWMIEGVKTDVTEREDFNVTFYDENSDSFIDKISWITPHLSEQEFILEFDITVINPWEYGTSGGDWIVYFNTTGTGTLNITKDALSNQVLTFNYLKCGETILYSSIGEYSYIIENYSCSEIAEISHTIGEMPPGVFGMQFDFGNDLNHDVDFAYDPVPDPDSDGDGLTDFDETVFALSCNGVASDPGNPNAPVSGGGACAVLAAGQCANKRGHSIADADGDCLSSEYETYGTGTSDSNADNDGGGECDYDEVINGRDPNSAGDDQPGVCSSGGGGPTYPTWSTAPTCSAVNSNSGATVCDANLNDAPGGECDVDGGGAPGFFTIEAENTSEVDCAVTTSLTITPALNFFGTASCTVRCGDGVGGTADSVVSITVNNQAPTHVTPTIAPTSPVTSSDLTATAQSVADPESQPVTAIYDWRKETVSIAKFNAQFDTNSSSTINDYSSLNNEFTNSGADWKGVSTCGLSGGCYDLTKISSTSGDYLYRADDSDFDGMSAISACLWIKPDSTLTDNTYFITKGNAFKLYYQSGLGVRWGLDQAGGYAAATFTGGSWHHVCGTWDTVTDVQKIYVNGNLVSTDARNLTTTGSNGYQIRIGASHQSYYWPMDGLVDGAQIYDVALTADQITAMYGSGTPTYQVIDSSMTSLNENWTVAVTPSDAVQDGSTLVSSNSNIGAPNTAPSDITPNSISVNENSAGGTTVGTLSATDSEGGSMTWSELTGGNGEHLFQIASSTGVVTVTSSDTLNYESSTSWTYEVRVEDSGGLTYDENITVNINNVNEAPVWASAIADETVNADSPSASVDSDLTNATGGGQCTDVDAGASLTFTVQTENTAQVNCAVSTNSLSQQPATNYSGTASCTIRCSDGTNTVDDTFDIVVSKTISMSISTNITSDLDWAITSTDGTKFNAAANNGSGSATPGYYVTVEAHGGEPNVTIKSSGALDTGSATIALSNYEYKFDSNNDAIYSSDTTMTTSYVNTGTDLNAGSSHIVYYKFFLTVPSATSAGTYNTTTYFQGVV